MVVFVQIIYYEWEEPFFPQLITTSFGVALALIPIYINNRTLIPRFLYEARPAKYALSVILLAILNTFFTYLVGTALYALILGQAYIPSEETFYYLHSLVIIFSVNISLVVLAAAFKIIVSRYNLVRELNSSQLAHTETELGFLRAQLNPHFFFNLLNAIYFQIKPTNLPARKSVELLADMMRYQLYECNSDTIPIKKEIDFFHSYIHLQRLRMNPDTKILFLVDPAVYGFRIAPLLLMPLVENAFKHLSTHPDAAQNRISITIKMQPNQLFYLHIENTHDEEKQAQATTDSKGLGIRNLKQRLKLVYPLRHRLHCYQEQQIFVALLEIKLS